MLWQIFGVTIVLMIIAYLTFARRSVEISSSGFFMTLLGVIVGLSVGALISLPLARLDDPFGRFLPIVVNIFSVAIITTFFYNQHKNIAKSLDRFFSLIASLLKEAKSLRREGIHLGEASKGEEDSWPIVLDTSAVIDGRIVDLARTGFLSGKLIVPRFVLDELQMIADSEDVLRRTKGRRGLESLNDLKRQPAVSVVVVDDDFPNEPDVDSKIIRLSKRYRGRLMTVDYNLNRVAQIQNVVVLNVNELNNALRPAVIPGEVFRLKIIQPGKDAGQGVGYLDDGTMVVVEEGGKYIGAEHGVMVTRVFQTVAGKMIFAVPEEKANTAVVSPDR